MYSIVFIMSVRSFRVEQILKKLGSDIRNARKRRGITVQLLAERMGVTRVTVAKLNAANQIPVWAITRWRYISSVKPMNSKCSWIVPMILSVWI